MGCLRPYKTVGCPGNPPPAKGGQGEGSAGKSGPCLQLAGWMNSYACHRTPCRHSLLSRTCCWFFVSPQNSGPGQGIRCHKALEFHPTCLCAVVPSTGRAQTGEETCHLPVCPLHGPPPDQATAPSTHRPALSSSLLLGKERRLPLPRPQQLRYLGPETRGAGLLNTATWAAPPHGLRELWEVGTHPGMPPRADTPVPGSPAALGPPVRANT